MDDDLPDLDLPEEFRKGVAFAELCASAEIAELRSIIGWMRERIAPAYLPYVDRWMAALVRPDNTP